MHAPRALVLVLALSLTAVAHAAPSAKTAARPAAAPKSVVPWIADDYTRALAEARARRVPLFIEAWAPW